MRERLVFIESNTSGTGRLFAAVARRLGFEPVLLTEDPLRYPWVQQDSVEFVLQSGIQNLDEVERCIEQMAARFPIAGIYSSSEYFIETAAEMARRRNLPGANPRAIQACRNKWTQRKLLQRVGGPAFARATSPQEAVDALSGIPLPVIVKPTVGTGSVGVRLCHTRSEVEAHAAGLLAVKTNERGMPIPQELLIEQYLTWPEYSAESLGTSLLGITRKHVGSEPYFVETGHDFPANLSSSLSSSVERLIRQALDAVGMDWGPAHTEFRCSDEGFAIMEINPRLAGGFIPELVRLSTGVDMIESTIRLVTGQSPSLAGGRKHSSSIRFICPSGPGKITGVRGVEKAVAVPGVVDVQMYKKIGDEILIHHDFRDRIGHVLSCDRHQSMAIEAVESAKREIAISIAPAALSA